MDHRPAEPQQSSASTAAVPPATEAASPPKRRHRWVWIVVLGAFALLFIAVVRHGTEGAAAQTPARGAGMGPVPVTTATAKTGDIRIYLDAIGTVTPVYTNAITPQVTGVITAVHYREGQFVHKGDPLIDLDSRPFAAQLEQARGTLEHDQQLLAQARMDLERYRQAWAHNGIPRQTLEDQEKVVLQLQGTVKFDEGAVHFNETQVSYCHIQAPISGRVGLRLIDPGNLVTANSTAPLVVITQMQPITVVFTAAEDHLSDLLAQMGHGGKLPVEAWDREKRNRIASGQLVTVDNQIDTTTGTVKIRANFDNKDGALFPNQFVNTRLPLETQRNQILVSSSAVQHNGDTAFVYLIQNSQAKMTAVKAGASDSGMTVVDGIHAGDVVANSSFEKLQDGSKVQVSNAQLPSTPSGDGAP